MNRDYSEEEIHEPPRCGECSIAKAPMEKSWNEEREEWYCELCEPLDD